MIYKETFIRICYIGIRQMTINVDIICDISTLVKFCKFYNLQIKESDINIDNIDEIFTQYIEANKSNNDIEIETSETLYDVKINDIININYYPLSQKYIDYYNEQSITGKVIFIDKDNDNLFVIESTSKEITNWLDKDIKYIFKSLEREGCSYLGTSRGYDFTINKIDISN
jgi:hypothetical protein